MKFSTSAFVLSCLLASGSAFVPALVQTPKHKTLTPQFMFGGAGEGVPSEDDPEALKQMEQAAKAMGMSVDEYKLGMKARTRLAKQLDDARVSGGDTDKVAIERDANNPPKHLEITITDAGKALGQEKVSSELVAALKSASEEARKIRMDAQKGMMQFIADEMKSMGKA